MEYKGIKFDAVVATPCCGKSYLCDKYPDRFVDADEVRLRCKYVVPENLTREELEKTKCDRPFKRRADDVQYVIDMENMLDQYVKQGKTLIVAPHPEAIEYLVKRNIKFAFVYQNKNMRKELVRRMTARGNSPKVLKEFDDMFDYFFEKNINENQSVVHYEFGEDEYLEDIIKKFGYKF
ncbi:MAG: hypothetical protein J6T39_01200 [Clostridia bacterium]|nr:hypothetical protein [Clostridia bacterium]